MSNLWISVDDKFKPEMGKEYLVKTTEGYTVAQYAPEGCYGWFPPASLIADYEFDIELKGTVLEWLNKDLEEIQ